MPDRPVVGWGRGSMVTLSAELYTPQSDKRIFHPLNWQAQPTSPGGSPGVALLKRTTSKEILWKMQTIGLQWLALFILSVKKPVIYVNKRRLLMLESRT